MQFLLLAFFLCVAPAAWAADDGEGSHSHGVSAGECTTFSMTRCNAGKTAIESSKYSTHDCSGNPEFTDNSHFAGSLIGECSPGVGMGDATVVSCDNDLNLVTTFYTNSACSGTYFSRTTTFAMCVPDCEEPVSEDSVAHEGYCTTGSKYQCSQDGTSFLMYTYDHTDCTGNVVYSNEQPTNVCLKDSSEEYYSVTCGGDSAAVYTKYTDDQCTQIASGAPVMRLDGTCQAACGHGGDCDAWQVAYSCTGDGWYYKHYYDGNQCSGTPAHTDYGIKTGSCIVAGDNFRSATCTSAQEVMFSRYQDDSCTSLMEDIMAASCENDCGENDDIPSCMADCTDVFSASGDDWGNCEWLNEHILGQTCIDDCTDNDRQLMAREFSFCGTFNGTVGTAMEVPCQYGKNFPLYYTEQAAKDASPTDAAHQMGEFYMPNDLPNGTYHGTYTGTQPECMGTGQTDHTDQDHTTSLIDEINPTDVVDDIDSTDVVDDIDSTDVVDDIDSTDAMDGAPNIDLETSPHLATFTATLSDVDPNNLPSDFDQDFKADVSASAKVDPGDVSFVLTVISTKRHLLAGAIADVTITFGSVELAEAYVTSHKAEAVAQNIFSAEFKQMYGAVTVDTTTMKTMPVPSPPPPSPSPPVVSADAHSGSKSLCAINWMTLLCVISSIRAYLG